MVVQMHSNPMSINTPLALEVSRSKPRGKSKKHRKTKRVTHKKRKPILTLEIEIVYKWIKKVVAWIKLRLY